MQEVRRGEEPHEQKDRQNTSIHRQMRRRNNGCATPRMPTVGNRLPGPAKCFIRYLTVHVPGLPPPANYASTFRYPIMKTAAIRTMSRTP